MADNTDVVVDVNEQRRQQSLQRHMQLSNRVARIKERGAPMPMPIRRLLAMLRPPDAEWPTPFETALINGVRKEFPEISEDIESVLVEQNCSCKGRVIGFMLDNVPRVQAVLDRAIGEEGIFKVNSRGDAPTRAGETMIIEPTPKAYRELIDELAHSTPRKGFQGLVVKDYEVDGKPKWLVLFY